MMTLRFPGVTSSALPIPPNSATAYSLRHTYICLRLMEGADIYQVAKNCRTSVEMIEKYCAAHIKTQLDAVAINSMRPKPRKKQNQPKTPNQSRRLTHEADV
jgi:hypothetical protein